MVNPQLVRNPAQHPKPVTFPKSPVTFAEIRSKTLMFNGYGEQVASLYAGMDLKKFY